jgi:type IV fimbrial biogenesis protein FimT
MKMSVKSNRNQQGFTILELMVAIAVGVILITLAIPNFQETFKRNAIAGQNNELVALIHMARNEAIRRNPLSNEVVRLELEVDAGEPAWRAFVYPPGIGEGVEGCPLGAIRCSEHERVLLSANSMTIQFDNRGYSVVGGVPTEVEILLVHRDCSSDQHARRIRVQPAGQVTSRRVACDFEISE